MDNRLNGYQRLEQDFFRLCRIRKIKGETRTILIYLRGLYCYFGKPIFYYYDSDIVRNLDITKDTIQKAKKKLQERGIIEYTAGKGRKNATEYLMLKTELLPELKGTKNSPFITKKQPFYTPKRDEKQPFYYKSNKDKSKERVIENEQKIEDLISQFLKPKTTKKPETNEEYLKRINDRRNLLQKQAIEMGVKL